MSKSAIASAVAFRHGLSQADAAKIVDTVTDMIEVVLYQHGRVGLRGFGTFELKARNSRVALNPRTGKKVQVPPRTVVRFVPSPALRDRVASKPSRK